MSGNLRMVFIYRAESVFTPSPSPISAIWRKYSAARSALILLAEPAALASKFRKKSMVPLWSLSASFCLTISSLSFGRRDVLMFMSALLPFNVLISTVSLPPVREASAFP